MMVKAAKAPTCPYHPEKVKAVLCDSSVIYGHSYGPIWMCPVRGCRAYVGVHKGSSDNAPKGTLANRETRKARKAAHAAFDPLWKDGAMRRGDAYAELAAFMGVDAKRCHIGYMNPQECERVVAFVQSRNAQCRVSEGKS